MLTLGTGVGGAAMVDGRLLLGNIGRAGHLGHVCLDPHGPIDVTNMPGSLEMMIAAHAVALGLILITNDRAFARIKQLKIEDWTK